MTLYFEETGAQRGHAPTIVFLHGLGISSWMWAEQIESLKQDYHCIAIDLPGNGESYQTEWLSFTDAAAQIAPVIATQATNGKAHIVGLSLGGYMALYLLRDHPQVVETMVISGVTPYSLHGIMRLIGRVLPYLLKFEPLINRSAKTMNLPDDLIPLYKRDAHRLTLTTLQRIYGEVLDYELPVVMAQREQRVLAVAGDAELKTIIAGLAYFTRLLPNAQAALVTNAHHAWHSEHPQLFTVMIRAWIENQPLPAGLTPT